MNIRGILPVSGDHYLINQPYNFAGGFIVDFTRIFLFLFLLLKRNVRHFLKPILTGTFTCSLLGLVGFLLSEKMSDNCFYILFNPDGKNEFIGVEQCLGMIQFSQILGIIHQNFNMPDLPVHRHP